MTSSVYSLLVSSGTSRDRSISCARGLTQSLACWGISTTVKFKNFTNESSARTNLVEQLPGCIGQSLEVTQRLQVAIRITCRTEDLIDNF